MICDFMFIKNIYIKIIIDKFFKKLIFFQKFNLKNYKLIFLN